MHRSASHRRRRTYTFFGHFAAARFWHSVHNWIGFPLAILSAVTIYSIFNHPIIATTSAIICTILATSNLYFRPSETSAQHHAAGEKFKSLRDRTRFFREVYLPHSSDSKNRVLERFEALTREKQLISEVVTPLPDFAYRRAKKKIPGGQSLYFQDQTEQPKQEDKK